MGIYIYCNYYRIYNHPEFAINFILALNISKRCSLRACLWNTTGLRVTDGKFVIEL